MEITQITVLEDVELNNPVFIEALPGIGHVGKLAADHMIDEFNATKFAEIYSPSFPPQVFVGEEGLIENMINELYYVKNVGEDNLDIIILVGNTQALSPEGQYGVCQDILNFVKGKGASKIFTLGGMATGQPVEESKIFGAATDEENIELLKEADLENVSGGNVKANAIKYSSAILGAALFSATGHYLSSKVGYKISPSYHYLGDDLEWHNIDVGVRYGRYVGTSIGAISGFGGGWKFGEYLCEKWKIEDKKAKK